MGNFSEPFPQTSARIRQNFDSQAMMVTLGAGLDFAADGLARISAPILDGSKQQHGFAHAGLTFSIGDSAGGYAALSIMAEDQDVLTSEMKIHLLAPAQGARLIACARVLKPGRRLVIVQTDIYAQDAEQDTHVAVMMGTMVPVPRSVSPKA